MAETSVPANDPTAVVVYSSRTLRQAIWKTTASKLMSVGLSADDPSNFVQYFQETAQGPGGEIKYDLIYNPFGPGVAGDNVIAGNEVPFDWDQDVIFIDQLRQAILIGGRMSQQRVPYSLRVKAKNGLANWWAQMFNWGLMNQLAGNTYALNVPYLGITTGEGAYNYTGMNNPLAPTTDGHWLFPQGATTESTVGTDPKYAFAAEAIPTIEAQATGALINPIKPIVIGSLEITGVIFLTPLQVKSLKTNYSEGEWGAIMGLAAQGGQVTGNPIFTGALGIIDNIVLHRDAYLPWGDGVNTNTLSVLGQTIANPSSLYGAAYATKNIGRAIFVGAQAGAFATGAVEGPLGQPLKLTWVEEPLDGANQLRIISGMITGTKKTQFGQSDYGVITYSTYVG